MFNYVVSLKKGEDVRIKADAFEIRPGWVIFFQLKNSRNLLLQLITKATQTWAIREEEVARISCE